jgi:outer membrane protein TolC
MKVKFKMLVLMLFSIPLSGIAQVTLEDCHQKARENYPLIRQYGLIEKSKDYTLKNANKAFLPQLNLNIIGGVIDGLPSFTPPGSSESSGLDFNMISVIQLNQTIWDGGVTKARKEMVVATSEIETAELEISLFALEDRVNNLYFGILLLDEQIRQVELFKTMLQRNYKTVENAVLFGTAYKTDKDEIEVELINTEQKMAELKSNRQAYMNVLAAMTGNTLNLDKGLIKPTADDDFLIAEISRPELRLFTNRKNMISAQEKMNGTALLPKVGLLGLGVFIQPGTDFGLSTVNNLMLGGLSVNWNIGGLYTNSNNKKLTEINLQKVAVSQETFLFNTHLELAQISQEIEKYETLLDQDAQLLTLKSRIRLGFENKYENGIATMTELLNKANEEHLAQQNMAAHQIQHLMKVYQYKNISGK